MFIWHVFINMCVCLHRRCMCHGGATDNDPLQTKDSRRLHFLSASLFDNRLLIPSISIVNSYYTAPFKGKHWNTHVHQRGTPTSSCDAFTWQTEEVVMWLCYLTVTSVFCEVTSQHWGLVEPLCWGHAALPHLNLPDSLNFILYLDSVCQVKF